MISRKGSRCPLQLLALAFGASLAVAQPPVPYQPPGTATVAAPKIPTVELTDESAKNAIDTYLTLREKYGDKIPAANQAQALAEGTAAAGDINAVVTAGGFADTREWQKAINSVAMAQGFLKEGNVGELDAKIAELQSNTEIPAAYKQPMIDMLKSMRPSENNLTVVTGLLADPAYAEKLAQIAK